MAVRLGGGGRAPAAQAAPRRRGAGAGLGRGARVVVRRPPKSREEVALQRVGEDAQDGRGLSSVGVALLGPPLLLRVGGGGAPQRGAVDPLGLLGPVFQLDGGAGRLQEAAVVEEAEDATALLGEGVQDEAVLCGAGERARGQRSPGSGCGKENHLRHGCKRMNYLSS